MSNVGSPSFEREKWQAELELRRRELELKAKELELKQVEQRRSRWSNPLTVAVFAAAIAATGNAVVATVNGNLGRKLEKDKADSTLRIEESKAESSRIFEMIKTGDPESAAANLRFLTDTGLITDATRLEKLNAYLARPRAPGSGVALPPAGSMVNFEATPDLTEPMQKSLESSLAEYARFLTDLGLLEANTKVSVQVKRLEGGPNAYYTHDSGLNLLVIDTSLAFDPDVARREFTHHALIPNWEAWSSASGMIESGFADYLVASNADRPEIAPASANVFGVSTPYLRTLKNNLKFEFIESLDVVEVQRGGEAWGGAFWAVRTALGRDITDRLLATAWKRHDWQSPGANDKETTRKFLSTIISGCRDVGQAEIVRQVFSERGFPL